MSQCDWCTLGRSAQLDFNKQILEPRSDMFGKASCPFKSKRVMPRLQQELGE
jgi:hypothetical protein